MELQKSKKKGLSVPKATKKAKSEVMKSTVPAVSETVQAPTAPAVTEITENLDAEALLKLPAVIDGDGYKLVNLNSIANATIQISGRIVAARLNSWNSDVFPWHFMQRVEQGMPFLLPLSSILLAPNFEDLEDAVPSLYQGLQSTIGVRRKIIKGMIDRKEPIPFELVPEAVHPLIGKQILIRRSSTNQVFGKLHSVNIQHSMFAGTYMNVVYTFYVWEDGKLHLKSDSFKIRPRLEDVRLEEWGFDTSPSQDVLDQLLVRGRKVVELNNKCGYIQVTGNLEYKVMWWWREAPATGRAIVDKSGHAIFNPDNRNDEDYEDMHRDGTGVIEIDDATEDDLRTVDPYLTIFSFVAKKWGRVHVNQVADIQFRNDSFEKLVMPEDDKKLVMSLVRNADASLVSDLIDNKGGGCVLLLHGKPGLGKTLTAEAVAEVLKRPLYSVSVGELGTNPEALETKLQTVLQTAQRWNAVLLLDEADVFLESRQTGDITRNAMVGTFLRLLEYYNGVLILTTNRVADMDKAFYSRISLALSYEDFNSDTREKVITNLLTTNNVALNAESIALIAKMNVNGRQVKNAIRLGRFLARDENRAVTTEDIVRVLNKLNAFQERFA